MRLKFRDDVMLIKLLVSLDNIHSPAFYLKQRFGDLTLSLFSGKNSTQFGLIDRGPRQSTIFETLFKKQDDG
jgi:hypothetical protein